MALAKKIAGAGLVDAARSRWEAAATRFRVLGRAAGLCWLELMPETGPTHQLRVHCAASGYPILGDAVYGTAPRFSGDPLMLHARAVSVPLYPKKDPVAVEAEAPAAMKACLARLAPPC